MTGVKDNGISAGEDRRFEPTGFLMKDTVCISPVLAAMQLSGNFFLCSTFDRIRGEYHDSDVYDLSTGECIAQYANNIIKKESLIILNTYGSNLYDINCPCLVISADGRLCTATEATGSLVSIVANDGKKGLYDNGNGKLIFSPDYDIIAAKTGDFYFIGKDGMWGIFSYNENVNTGLTYPGKECPFKIVGAKGPIILTSNGKAGLLDIKGNELLKCEYDNISESGRNDIYLLEKDGKSMTYNITDKTMTMRKYSGYKRFVGAKNYYLVEQNGKFGVVDDKDNLVLPFKYSQITEAITSDNGYLDEGFHVWDANGRIGVVKVINGKGKEIVPCTGNYDSIWGYEPYGIIVKKNGKEGCIKENGAVFCKIAYDGHINGMKRVGFVKNSATSNDVTVDIYDYNGKYLTTVNVGNNYLEQRWFVQKYLM